ATFKKDEPLRMTVVTEDGLFHLFEHTLNEKLKKPLSPKITIQIASKGNSNSKTISCSNNCCKYFGGVILSHC
ncbi:hypothetical protein TNIN_27931, partial [Trichonephila inaurata madagascariensis]